MSSPILEVRRQRATSVIVQRVPQESSEAFLEWQRGISSASAAFTGYQSTEIFPPEEPAGDWVILIHFDNSDSLREWLQSTIRSEWIARMPGPTRSFRLKTLPVGFGAWFAALAEDADPLPRWKKMTAVLCGLYPTVMALTLILSPHTQSWNRAAAILLSNAGSVVFLEFVGMPLITRLLKPWLSRHDRRSTTLGAVAIAMALALLVFMFSFAG